MEFEEYLKSKKIDPRKFASSDSEQYNRLKVFFDQVSPESFTQQKLFLINRTRRKYLLDAYEEVQKEAPKKALKPKIKPLKPKTS